MNNALTPSLQMLEMFSCATGDNNQQYELFRLFAQEGFYSTIEMDLVYDRKLAQEISQCKNANGIRLVTWLSKPIQHEMLEAASLQENVRKRSVFRIKELLAFAARMGADAAALLSGPNPGAGFLEEAECKLCDSLIELGETAKQLGITLLLEPLDRGAHKDALIGPMSDAVRLIKAVQDAGAPVGIVWDSAHAALNGEDLVQSIRQGNGLIHQAHLSNAVLDRNDPGFGDNHMKYGPPGFLSVTAAAQIATALAQLSRPFCTPLPIAIEMHNKTYEEAFRNEKESRQFLTAAIVDYMTQKREMQK